MQDPSRESRFELETVRAGWQHEASSRVEESFRDARVLEQALIRSQAESGAGAALTVAPTSGETTIPSHLFRVVALPLSVRNCADGDAGPQGL